MSAPPLTKDNPDVLRHVALEVADELRKAGRPRTARVLIASVGRALPDAQPLAPGCVIPPEIRREAYAFITGYVAKLDAEVGVLTEREH